jgi:NmrA-like family
MSLHSILLSHAPSQTNLHISKSSSRSFTHVSTMSKQYVRSQPAGYKNRISKVALVGAGGHVGKYIAAALLETGQHTVTAITRPDSKNTAPAGVSIAKVNYQDQASLVDALQGHDALIITMSVMAPSDSQTQLIDAAATAGVPWVMPNEYSSDPTQKEMQRDIQLGLAHEKLRAYVAVKDGMSTLGLACSFWYEHSLCSFPFAYGFDVENKAVTFYDDGNTKISTSTWPQCGLAVARLLSLPILPEDDGDKSLTLDQFRDKHAYISSFFVSQKDIFASVLRVTGTKETEWKIEYEDSKKRFEDGQKEAAAGNRMGFGKMLYARMFYQDGCGNIEGKLHNEALGLPKEDLDEYTKKGIELAESGYGKWYT